MELEYFALIFISTALLSKSTKGDCGRPYFSMKSEVHNRIVGGFEAKPHSFPWQVHLRIYYSPTMHYSCGGSLIEPLDDAKNGSDLILTAAHCMHDRKGWIPVEQVKIIAGAHNVKDLSEPSQEIIELKKYLAGVFNKYTLENDIAILLLNTPVRYNNYILPVCLPKSGDSLPRHVPCYVSGWGADSEYGRLSSVLKQVDTPILPNALCWEQAHPEKAFCAGHLKGKKDACLGDSGGALVCEMDGRFVQYGIVSYGHGCGLKSYPGIYTRVSHYVPFIRKAEAKFRRQVVPK